MFRGRLVGRRVGRKRCFSYMDCTKRVSGAKLEDIVTWNLNYQDKNVVMLIGTNNLGGKLFNDATRQEFITDFVDEYKRMIEGLAPRRVFVISILPRNREPAYKRLYQRVEFCIISNGRDVELWCIFRCV